MKNLWIRKKYPVEFFETYDIPFTLSLLPDTTKLSNDNDFDDFVAAPSKSNGTSSNGSNNNGQFSTSDLDQLGPAFASNNATSNKDNAGTMSKDSIMALFNTPKSGLAAPANQLHMNSNNSGQQAFTGFPSNLQSQGTQFNLNGSAGNKFGMSQPFQNSSIPATGSLNLQQQPTMLGIHLHLYMKGYYQHYKMNNQVDSHEISLS